MEDAAGNPRHTDFPDPSLLSVVLRHTARLYAILDKSSTPADKLVPEYLHSKKQLDAGRRKLISELAYQALRMKPLLDACGGGVDVRLRAHGGLKPGTGKTLETLDKAVAHAALAHVLRDFVRKPGTAGTGRNWSPDLLDRFELCRRAITDEWPGAGDVLLLMLERYVEMDLDAVNGRYEAARCCLPDWMMDEWMSSALHPRTRSECFNLGLSLCMPAQVCLRVNTRVMDVDSVLDGLAGRGIAAHRGRLAPACIRLEERPHLPEVDLFRSGAFEVQDEGSQMIALALAPEPGWSILDACAGSGGKSLHMADLQGDTGNIIALDTELNRLREIPLRARRLGLNSIRTMRVAPRADKRNIASSLESVAGVTEFDAVLVDAPCSATGTSRRSPQAKLRLTPALLKKLSDAQSRILDLYASFVRPGGVLVYATCSLMPAENEDVVSRFLNEHPEFGLDMSGPEFFDEDNVGTVILADKLYGYTLNPLYNDTDGFFVTRMMYM
jgi:16S rRNA (cytosine967-C5)-methyltransferase